MRVPMPGGIHAEAEKPDLRQRGTPQTRLQSAVAGQTAIPSPGEFQKGPQGAPEGRSKLRNVT
jgi:hypothetical protein